MQTLTMRVTAAGAQSREPTPHGPQSGFSYLTGILREPWQPTLYPTDTHREILPGWMPFNDKSGEFDQDLFLHQFDAWLASQERRRLLFQLGRPTAEPTTA